VTVLRQEQAGDWSAPLRDLPGVLAELKVPANSATS
jgi:hypothetical protein